MGNPANTVSMKENGFIPLQKRCNHLVCNKTQTELYIPFIQFKIKLIMNFKVHCCILGLGMESSVIQVTTITTTKPHKIADEHM